MYEKLSIAAHRSLLLRTFMPESCVEDEKVGSALLSCTFTACVPSLFRFTALLSCTFRFTEAVQAMEGIPYEQVVAEHELFAKAMQARAPRVRL